MKAIKKTCIRCGSIMISSEEVCSSCREKEYRIKTIGCYMPLQKPKEPDWYIHCPKCNSSDVWATGIVTVYATCEVNRGFVEDTDQYDGNPYDDFDEFTCNNCAHEWKNPNY